MRVTHIHTHTHTHTHINTHTHTHTYTRGGRYFPVGVTNMGSGGGGGLVHKILPHSDRGEGHKIRF